MPTLVLWMCHCQAVAAAFIPIEAAWHQHASVPLLREYILAGATFLLPIAQRIGPRLEQSEWDAIIGLSKVVSQADFRLKDQNVKVNTQR